MVEVIHEPVVADGSLFDSIKQHRPDGVEFWSGRDLMNLMGYSRWETFETPLNRAMATARNEGHDLEGLFHRSVEKGAGRPRTDYLMVRYAAYLVAMNGDPNMPEVAAAQSYFAHRTREAEAAQPQFHVPKTLSEALRAYADAEDDRVAERERRLELEGPAAERELYRSSAGLQLVDDVANRFKTYAQERYPDVKVLNKQVWDHAGRLNIIIRGNTVRHNQPTSQAIKAEWAKPSESTHETRTRGTVRTVTTRLTPKGEARLWDGLVRYIEERGSLDIKEVTA